MKKENIINDLSDKLKMLTQQQEKDKGKFRKSIQFFC